MSKSKKKETKKKKLGKKKAGKKDEKPKREIKEIKETRKIDSGIEDEAAEIETNSDFMNFSQTSRRISPILEQITTAGNVELEEQLANIPVSKENEEQKTVSYGGTKLDYGTAHETRKKDTFKYSEKTSYGTEKEKTDDKNKLTRQDIRSEWKEDREDRWKTEGMNSIEEPPEKKYFPKGEY